MKNIRFMKGMSCIVILWMVDFLMVFWGVFIIVLFFVGLRGCVCLMIIFVGLVRKCGGCVFCGCLVVLVVFLLFFCVVLFLLVGNLCENLDSVNWYNYYIIILVLFV